VEFYASIRDIGRLAGLSSPAASVQRWLGALSRMGYLSRVRVGTQGTRATGKASQWAWHDPPRPGRALWDVDAATVERRRARQTADDVPF
jgi:hypothetical protein